VTGVDTGHTPQPGRRALLATVLLLVAAAAALGGASAMSWATVGFQVPLRGIVPVQVHGADLAPSLGPLALLALAAVAAVLASGGWARPVLGVLLLLVAIPPVLGVLALTDQGRLSDVAVSAAELPARSSPAEPATLAVAGPALASVGALLLAGAAAVLVVRGHRMPRMGRRYRVPAARDAGTRDAVKGDVGHDVGQALPQGRLWERMDAGEDPTADPR
jgi:uncharacterized membrane protein (TIGR02234 family)